MNFFYKEFFSKQIIRMCMVVVGGTDLELAASILISSTSDTSPVC